MYYERCQSWSKVNRPARTAIRTTALDRLFMKGCYVPVQLVETHVKVGVSDKLPKPKN